MIMKLMYINQIMFGKMENNNESILPEAFLAQVS